MPERIFLLSGTPGSGKSSVAFALMQRFPRGMHIPVDDLREWVVSGIAHPIPVWTYETARQFALARQAGATIARLYSEADFAVVVDDVIFLDAVQPIEEILAGLPVTKVLLRPGIETALSRNSSRTNKAFDTTLLDETIRVLYEEMNPQNFADAGWLVIDSTALNVEETVDKILASDFA